MKKTKKRALGQGWYFYADGLDFSGIKYFDVAPKDSSFNGPFGTYLECKREAIEFFMFYVRRGRFACREIRQFRKPPEMRGTP